MENDVGTKLQVIAADGGELAASITAASLALADSGMFSVIVVVTSSFLY